MGLRDILLQRKAAALTASTELQPQQERVVEKIQHEPGLLVYHGLGSGKTLASIAAGEAIPGPKEVVVPASLRGNYRKELAKYLRGRPKDYNIESYVSAANRGTMPPAALTIFDEAQRMGREGTAVSELGGEAQGKKLLLSGTPVRNEPSEILPLLRAISPDRDLPGSAKAFDDRFIRKKPIWPGIIGWLRGIKPGVEKELINQDELRGLFRGRVDYHPSAGDFPTTSTEDIDVDMSSPQQEIYEGLGHKHPIVAYKVRHNLPPSKADATNLNAFLAGVRQVSNTPTPYQAQPDAGPFESSPKLNKMSDEIQARADQPNFKAVVYSNYLDSGIVPLAQHLVEQGIPSKMFTGSMNDTERKQTIDDYNSGRIKVLLISGAGAEGLDLKGTQLMQIMEPHWNQPRVDQVIGRAVRNGSHTHLPPELRNVHIQRFYSTPKPGMLARWGLTDKDPGADRYLQNMSVRKQKLVDQLLNLLKEEGSQPYKAASLDMTKLGDAAMGLPDRSRFGATEEIPRGKLLQYVIQRHLAERAGPHYDVRIGGGPPGGELYSWATKKEMPPPGGKIMLYQQPLHRGSYAKFEGTLHHGYGKGTVKTHDAGSVMVTKAEPNKISFVVAHKKYPEYYTMIRSSGPPTQVNTERQRRSQGGSWLLINTTPMSAAKLLGGRPDQVGLSKLKYTSIPAEKVDKLFSPEYLHQEKLDGASALYHLLADKIEAVSYRQSKTGRPIIHTHRVFGPSGGKSGVKVPPELVGTILRGEIYGTRQGKAIPPQELGGILNSSVANSIRKQREQHVRMRNMLFDVVRLGKQPIEPNTLSAEERMQHLQRILPMLPKDQFHLPQTEAEPAEQKRMWEDITAGKNPRTQEGIVAWPTEGGKPPVKVKTMPEADVWIKNIFPGEGKYQGTGAGGFEYSNEPKGDIVGRVGTGFSDETRREMHESPDLWTERMARIKSQGKFPDSGAHRAPVFIARHEDYPLAEATDV